MTNILTNLTCAALAFASIASLTCRVLEDRIEARAAVESRQASRYDATRPRGKRYH